MKILILKNVGFEINTDIQKVINFFTTRIPVQFTFETKEIKLSVSITQYKTIQGFNKVTGKPAVIRYMGLSQAVIDACKQFVVQGQYDRVVLVWDMDTVCIDVDAAVTSWTMSAPLYPTTEFIQLAVNQYIKSQDSIWKMLSHEMLHADCYASNRKGIFALDEMDNTVVGNIIVSFYKNDDPTAIDGNYAHTIKNLSPYYVSMGQNTLPETISLSKWKLVPELEKKASTFLIASKKAGYNLKITQGWRDPAYQDKLYAQGRTLPGKIVTNATGKTSKHCLGKAFDFAYNGKDPYPKTGKWEEIGKIGESVGLKWGGRWTSFRDQLHFEI